MSSISLWDIMKNKYIRHLVDKLFCPIGPAKQRIIWYIFSFVPLHPFLLSLHPFLFVNFSLSLPLNFISLSSPLCLCHIIHSSSSYPRRHITHFVFFLIYLMKPRFFSCCHTIESQVLLPPWKNRVDFTGYPSNHFPGCRLNEFMSLHLFLFVGSSLSTPLYPCLLISWFSSIPLIPFCLVCYFHPFLFIHSSLSIL